MNDLQQSNHSISNIIQVENYGSEVSTLFKILSSVQVTVESCTGLNAEDSYNIMLLSPRGCWFRAQRSDMWFRTMNARGPHRHDYFELLIVLQGEVIQQIEGQDYRYRAGTCCLINRSILHTEKFIGPAQICFIGLSVNFVRELLDDMPELLFIPEKTLPENSILQFMKVNLTGEVSKEYQDLFPSHENPTAVEDLHNLVDKLLNILMQPTAGATYYAKGILCELLNYLQHEFYAIPVRLNAGADRLLFLRIRRLLEDTNGRLSRSELSEALHYNGSYLNEITQRFTGMCLFDYGMTFCMKEAANLLLETDLPITEIAVRLRFTNRTHFYTIFKKQFGLTPQQYRKEATRAKNSADL